MQHNDGDLEECYVDVLNGEVWEEVLVDTFERAADDCTLNTTALSGLDACDPVPVEGDSCADGGQD